MPKLPQELPGSDERLKKRELLSGMAMSAATARQRMEMFRQTWDGPGRRGWNGTV